MRIERGPGSAGVSKMTAFCASQNANVVQTMPNIPRKHHYVPQFYLAGFTECGTRKGRLYVLDQGKKKQWSSTVKDTAHQRDFHSVDLGPHVDPMGVEKALAHFEGQQSAILAKILEERTLPPGEDETFDGLMSFVAFMAVRVPRIRKAIEGFIDRIMRKQSQAFLATKAGRETFRNVMEDHKATLSPAKQGELERFLEDDPDLSKMAEFAGDDAYTIGFDQTWDVQTMLHAGIMLMPLLSQRNWSLWVAEANVPALVCSDSPVSLTWATTVRGQGPFAARIRTPEHGSYRAAQQTHGTRWHVRAATRAPEHR